MDTDYAAEALARRIRNELLGDELRQYEREHGAFTDEERAQADALLHDWPSHWPSHRPPH